MTLGRCPLSIFCSRGTPPSFQARCVGGACVTDMSGARSDQLQRPTRECWCPLFTCGDTGVVPGFRTPLRNCRGVVTKLTKFTTHIYSAILKWGLQHSRVASHLSVLNIIRKKCIFLSEPGNKKYCSNALLLLP